MTWDYSTDSDRVDERIKPAPLTSLPPASTMFWTVSKLPFSTAFCSRSLLTNGIEFLESAEPILDRLVEPGLNVDIVDIPVSRRPSPQAPDSIELTDMKSALLAVLLASGLFAVTLSRRHDSIVMCLP